MAEATMLWKEDASGKYIEMVLGQKKDMSINWADYFPSGETINPPTWSAPTGVTFSNPAVNDKTTKVYVQADAVGEHNCSVNVTVLSGLYIEPFAFRVIVK